MIRFFQTRGHAYTLKHVRRAGQGPRVRVMTYDALFRARGITRGPCVFSDLDRLGYWDLELAADLYVLLKDAGVPVYNNPARFKNRFTLLRALHAAGLNDFNAYRIGEIASIRQFPVFLRKIQGHRAPLSGLLENAGAVAEAVAAAISRGVPEENLVVIECLAEPVRPGLYRKLAAFRIGEEIVPHLPVHDKNWLVKYGHKFDNIDDQYALELAELKENPHAAHLRKVFEVAGIEYGRADYGFYRGRIQVFEINTNPHVAPGKDHPSETRRACEKLSWETYLQYLRGIDAPGGGRVRLADGALQRGRPWKNLLVRTRKVH